jgi:hypothetical protein
MLGPARRGRPAGARGGGRSSTVEALALPLAHCLACRGCLLLSSAGALARLAMVPCRRATTLVSGQRYAISGLRHSLCTQLFSPSFVVRRVLSGGSSRSGSGDGAQVEAAASTTTTTSGSSWRDDTKGGTAGGAKFVPSKQVKWARQWRMSGAKGVLLLPAEGALEDVRARPSPLQGLSSAKPPPPTLLSAVSLLRKAAADDQVASVYLRIGRLSCSAAKVEELRAAVRRCVEAGTPVVGCVAAA